MHDASYVGNVWVSDRLTMLGIRPIIASLSLGATRLFRMRRATRLEADAVTAAGVDGHKSTSTQSTAAAIRSQATANPAKSGSTQSKAATMPATDIMLEHNSLLIMMPPSQEAFKHEVLMYHISHVTYPN